MQDNQEHATVKVSDRYGYQFDIDTLIAPLIEKIWSYSINTENSCENNVPEGYIWIEFSTPDDLLRFMQLVWNGTDGINGTWEMTLCPEEQQIAETIKITGFSASLRFPQSGLPFVMEQLHSNDH